MFCVCCFGSMLCAAYYYPSIKLTNNKQKNVKRATKTKNVKL